MRNSVIVQFLSRHTLICIYLIVFVGLLFGVYKTTGLTYFPELLAYLGSLVFFYFLFQLKWSYNFLEKKLALFTLDKVNLNINYLVFPAIAFLIYHLIYLGGSPAVAAANLNYVEDVAKLRHSLTVNVPTWIAYSSAIMVKGVLPFLLLYLLHTKRQVLYWVVLILACFYAFSLMQKSFIVGLLIPSFIYSLAARKFLFTVKYVCIIGIVVFGLIYISNPSGGWSKEQPMEVGLVTQLTKVNDEQSNGNGQSDLGKNSIVNDTLVVESQTDFTDSVELVLVNDSVVENTLPETVVPEKNPLRQIDPEVISEQAKHSKFGLILYGLYDRLLVVPGRVVSDWFETIPAKKPFLNGDGYRIFAIMKGIEHVNYGTELYPILQPEFAAQGLSGTVNVASFMYEYSNFGTVGLIISGLILALLFGLVEIYFKNDIRMKLSINLYPVLLLSSGAITTLLFSGGWGFCLLFYFLFLKNKIS